MTAKTQLSARSIFAPAIVKFQLWRRNRKKLAKLREADVVLMRYPKSGVTWLRVMISRVYQLRHSLPESEIVGRGDFRNAGVPNIYVAMDNFGLAGAQLEAKLKGKRVILLLRDPRDIAVSLYFHFSKRSTALEREVFQIPDDIESRGQFAFVTNPAHGLPRIIEFMNLWFHALRHRGDAAIVRYEDMRRDGESTFARVMKLIDPGVTEAEIASAVQFADFEQMKEKEREGSFDLDILRPGDHGDADSFKVRRGVVGGYADYFTAEEKQVLDRMVMDSLHPDIGYR